MKKIYLLLTATDTYFARFIRFYTRKPYSHVSISFNKDCTTAYSFSRTYTNNPFLGSFQKERIDKGIFGRCENIPCEILEIEVSDGQYNKLKKTIHQMDGKRYNRLGLLAGRLRISYHSENRYFCSEFVAYALEESGIYHFKKPLNFVEPCDFLKLPITNSIYQGDYKEKNRRKI